MANSLINEESPYLQQHANNPVNWYPWSKEAFEKAAKEGKAIFLSIGYSSCHWCHVMEKESFEDENIAKKLNENFICIKVDKEERPDIDRHFQEIYTKMNNKAGGWPLSIFMTPEKVPFYSATYIPPVPNYGIMGFGELIDIIASTYKKDSNMLKEKGQEVLNALKPKSKIEATKITKDLEQIAIKQLKQVYDKDYGGFGDAPKFPHATTLELAINLYKLSGDSELKEIVTHTLDSMLLGGIYDIVEGGFCRYSTDRIWLIPHFEKMTYDNALMLKVLVQAHKTFDIKRYKDIVLEIAEFMLNRMSKDNLFFSASDADSDGVEGKYFIYSYNEAKEALEKEGINSDILYDLGITKNGNFDGKNIVRLSSIELREDTQIKKAIKALRSLREQREYPFVDKKVITSWNAMFIDALFKLASIEPKYLQIAQKSLQALEDKMSIDNKLYHSALIENSPKIEAFLEDFAWLISANISAYSATLDELYLIKATNLTNEAVKRFYKNGRWQVGDGEFTNFVEDYDTSFTSSLALMVQNLLTMRSLVEPIYEKFAFQTLQVCSYNLMRQPISRPTLTDSAIRYIKDDNIIKSSLKNLEKIKSWEFNYPYIWLKVTNSQDIEICSNKACFASFKSVDELKKYDL